MITFGHYNLHPMKKVLIPLSVLVVVLSFTQCGPAAEDRNVMYANAKRVRDSIGKDIDDQLAKGAIPGTATVAPAPADTAKAAK
jgi:hypothetical protein